MFLQNNFNYFIAIIRSNRILFSNDQMVRRRGRLILYLFFAQTNCNCIQCSKSDKKSSLDGGRKIAAGTGAIATLPSSSSSYRLISIETPFCNWRPAAAASHPEEPQNEPSELWRPLLTATSCTLLHCWCN